MPFDSAQQRALIIGSVEVGELVIRAFILRREFLIETGAGLVLLGSSDSPEALRLQNFLRRNAVPYTLLDPSADETARQLIVAHVHLLCRSGRLGDNMSQYLVERIHALPNVEVHTQTELVELIGDGLEGLHHS